jgi:large subunit ribosomal protein L13
MIKRELYTIDAEGQVVGRIATKIASLLRGKNKPEFQPNIDNGGAVEVVNINKLKFSGKKIEQKKYFRYTGYPGGIRETKMSDLNKLNPAEILKRAVKQMLPDTRLRTGMMKRLKIK